ncbi:Translation initiation factor 3 [Macrophomina phaseolina MS6]|uniref:Translation initiation factor 3 n=2 Tax=Macrophomina phaseolina TaxID=35725 RepID=K2SV32_MACPH|nr:Translation initiation factor 3 [Macrophomina phaseolina MS6]KAH7042078.1 hypothetical protein B0J12DRAFT_674659 [Macrophomina phaseolina]
MAHARYIASTAQALYRVFIQPSISTSALRATTTSSLRPTLPVTPSFIRLPPQRWTAVKYRPAARPESPYDEKICSELINLVDSEGVFHPGVPLISTLQTFDRASHHLVQVDVSPEDSEHPYPICKVVDKATLREQERQMAKTKTKKSAEELTKRIELNWAISANDLNHWLKRLKEFLEEGRRVEVIVGPRRRGRKATTEEARAVLDRVKEAVEEVKGAKERIPAQGQFGGIMIFHYEGLEKPKEKEEKVENHEVRGNEGDKMPKVSRWKIKEEERRKKAEEEKRRREIDGQPAYFRVRYGTRRQ